MESKQYISKQPTAYWKNQKWNKKIFRNKWQWKHDNSKLMACSKSSSRREVYSNTILPQETRKTSNRQPNFTPKTTGKRRTKKPPKLVEGNNHKYPSRNKWKTKNERNNMKILIKLKAGSLRR